MLKGKLRGFYWDTSQAVKVNQTGRLNQIISQRYPSVDGLDPDHILQTGADLIDLNPDWLDQLKQLTSRGQTLIYGDYDADGVISSFILSVALKRLNRPVKVYLPHRQRDGYGINLNSLKRISRQFKFNTLITIDNGVTAGSVIDQIRSQGKLVGVIDHHQANEKVLADMIIHQTATCASGLAFGLVLLMHQRGLIDLSLYKHLLQLASIGILADQMPLNQFNYQTVKAGFESFNQDGVLNSGIRQILSQAGWRKPIDEYAINYIIAPRLNAPGRLESPLTAYQLLGQTNPVRANNLAIEVERLNSQRQRLTKQFFDLFQQSQPEGAGLDHLVWWYQPDIPEGIIGLLAGKISQAVGKPTLVITGVNKLKGSGRGPAGFDLTGYLKNFKEHLTSLGGHQRACGFSLTSTNLERLKESLRHQVVKAISYQTVDFILSHKLITPETVFKIESLSPFGHERQRPVFLTEILASQAAVEPLGKDKNHHRIRITGGSGLDIIAFNTNRVDFKAFEKLKLVTTTSINHYNGRQLPQLRLIDLI